MTDPSLPTKGTEPDPHGRCHFHGHSCGLPSCPPSLAKQQRRDARAGEWSRLLAPQHGWDPYTLAGQPLSCNTFIELQAIEERADDYGSYPAFQQHGVLVRFEIAHTERGRIPMLHATVGGYTFVSKAEEWMRFRWPQARRAS